MSGGPRDIVVLGLGNALRHDDGVGLLVARHLETLAQPRVEVRTHSGDCLALLDAWDGVTASVVVDAVSSGAPAGTVSRFDASTHPLPGHLKATRSTHDFGLGDAVELARAMERLPDRLIVFGVEGSDFSRGSGLSSVVEGAVEGAVEAVLKEIGSLAKAGPSRKEAEDA